MNTLINFITILTLTLPLPNVCSAMDMDSDEENISHAASVRSPNNSCPHCSHLREDCLLTRTHGGGSSGKWLDSVTPKRGWHCIGAEDLGDGNLEECEMCEREQVRYIHHMVHGNINPLSLRVGCICSGHMEGRFEDKLSMDNAAAAARRRVTELQNRAARRVSFPTLNRWKISTEKGNPHITYNGKHITIFKKNGLQMYSAVISDEGDRNGGKFIPGMYPAIQDAKLAAFDYLYPARVQ